MSQIHTTPARTRLVARLSAAALAVLLLVASPGSARAATFLRGDTNGDGRVALTDVLSTLGALFLGTEAPACPDAADANDTGLVDVADCLYTLTHLFRGGPAPPSPGTQVCGLDPTPDALGPCSSSACDSGRRGGPGPLALPADNAAEVAAQFAQGLVREAVGQVLNSNGDAIELHLKGSVSVAPIVPGVGVNVSVSIDPSIQATADGGFELALAMELAGGVGVQLYEGVEAGVMDVTKSKVICRFDSLDEALSAVEGLVAAEALLPLSGAALDVLGAFETLAHQLDQAVDELDLSRRAEQAIRDGIAGAQGTIAAVEAKIAALSKPIRDAQAEIRRLEDALEATCGRIWIPGCDALQDLLGAARSALGTLDRQKAALVRQLGRVRGELGGLQAALQPAVDAVRAAEALVGELEGAIAATREGAERAQEVLAVIARSEGTVRATAAAIELRKSRAGKIEAFLSPFPGVKVEGAGLGGELSSDTGVTARVELDQGGDAASVTLTLSNETKLAVTAALGAGVKAGAGLQLAAILGFQLAGEGFEQVTGKLEVTLDAQAVVVGGIGVTLQYGAGTKLGLSMDLAQTADIAGGLWELARRGDGASLFDAFTGLEATYSRQDRRIAAAVASYSVGELGNGAGIEASATWNDQGALTEQELEIGEAAVSLFQSDAVQDLIESLQEAVAASRA